MEKISKNFYMNRRAVIPDAVAREWNDFIKPRLDRDLQKLIEGISTGTDHILSTMHFCMAGAKHGDILDVKPTILIICGRKQYKKSIAKNLDK